MASSFDDAAATAFAAGARVAPPSHTHTRAPTTGVRSGLIAHDYQKSYLGEVHATDNRSETLLTSVTCPN